MSQRKRFRDVKQKKEKSSINESADKSIKKSRAKAKKEAKSRYRYARVSTKIKAFITDIFMLMMPIMYAVVYLMMDGREGFADHMVEGWLAILIPNFIIVFLFFWKSGQTPGCKAYNIKLIDNKTGEQPHPLAIGLRYYFELISIISLVGLFMAFFREDRRTFHDLLSGTLLVDIDDQPKH